MSATSWARQPRGLLWWARNTPEKPGLYLERGRVRPPRRPLPPVATGDLSMPRDTILEMLSERDRLPATTLIVSSSTVQALSDPLDTWEWHQARWRKQRWERKRRKRRALGRGRW